MEECTFWEKAMKIAEMKKLVSDKQVALQKEIDRWAAVQGFPADVCVDISMVLRLNPSARPTLDMKLNQLLTKERFAEVGHVGAHVSRIINYCKMNMCTKYGRDVNGVTWEKSTVKQFVAAISLDEVRTLPGFGQKQVTALRELFTSNGFVLREY